MTLEELKALWEAAKAKALAAPDDTDLQKASADAEIAYNEAVIAAAGTGDPGNDDPDLDESKLDEKTKKYLAKLRKENAGHRTKNKDLASGLKSEKERTKAILKAAGIEVESEKPEEQIKTLSAQTQNLAFRNAVLESAVQHGIPASQIDYYEFLLNKATSELEEGEELPDEAMAAIVAKVKANSGKSANSTVNGDGKGGNAPQPGQRGTLTLDKFCLMSMSEKSKLYVENQSLYLDLMSQARAKKKLV